MQFSIAILLAGISCNLLAAEQATSTTSTPTAKKANPEIAPRRPALPPVPAGSKQSHPVDLILLPYYAAQSLRPPAPVEDRVYARRVSLDIVGMLPSPQELEIFLADQRPDKRARLVKSLLADQRRYAEHWLTFWNDALRNDYRGTGYIDGGRKQITEWLYSALASNKPYDQFVRELISPTPESEGFVKGIVWRGVVNASQVPPMQAAQNLSQVFMGINLKCASCHDSFINDWKLADAYGLAGAFSEGPLEMHRCDQPTGKFAPMKFLYPELGPIDAAAPRGERLKQLAAIVTSRENGRFARTIVNRLWARFLGRGLIEPVDEMEDTPWNQDLLDWLAADLVDHDYDLKQTIERILTSEAYQLSAVGLRESAKDAFVFRGPAVRRMAAEQYCDAVAALTGPWYAAPAVQVSAPVASPATAPAGSQAAPVKFSGKWIWKDKNAARATEGGRIFLRKSFELTDLPGEAVAVLTCDNQFTLFINGKQIVAGTEWQKPARVDLKPHLVKGKNVIAVEAINWPDPETGVGLQFSSPNGAGFIFGARIGQSPSGAAPAEATVNIGSDASWLWNRKKVEGWEKPEFKTEGWQHAFELADATGGPWTLAATLQTAFQATGAGAGPATGTVRAALVNSDPLQTALGRTNREQVVTGRPQAATTLQALELTNGATLSAQLERGAKKWLAEAPAAGGELVNRMYLKGLGRSPNPQERAVAEGLLGSPITEDGIEDLLWVMVMLPEFQLIY